MGEASDAVVKQVSAFPWMAESAVTLRRLGYTKAEIDELLEDKRRSESASRLGALIEVAKTVRQGVTGGDIGAGGAVSAGESVPGGPGAA
jgi:hypothetical protein